MRKGIRTSAALQSGVAYVAMVMMISCNQPPVMDTAYPGDLSLVVTVRPGLYAGKDDPAWAPAQYVVQSDRTLRVAWGPNVQHDVYPPTTTAVLRSQEMATLYRIIEAHELTAASSAEGGRDEPRYQVEITAEGRTHRYATTPGESPGTAELVRALAGFYRSGR